MVTNTKDQEMDRIEERVFRLKSWATNPARQYKKQPQGSMGGVCRWDELEFLVLAGIGVCWWEQEVLGGTGEAGC